jgi:hypothetical protein
MGNFITKIENPPQKGQIYTIVDTPFTREEEYPKELFGQGSKVKVIGSKYLLSSNPNAPKILVSIIQFENGYTDVYPSSNLKII